MVKKIIVNFAICLLFSACCSTRRTDQQILEYQRQISEYESQLRDRDRTIEDCDRTIKSAVRELEAVTARSEGMGADFDDVICELDEYQRAVEREHMKNKQMTKALFVLVSVLVLLILSVGLVLYLELTHKTNFI